MTPRLMIEFAVLYGAVVIGEWFYFLKGFDTSQWTFSNWVMLVFVLLAEAGAMAIITAAVDRAIPSMASNTPAKASRQKKRVPQRSSAR